MIEDPLFLPGWIKFNEEYWGLTGQILTLMPEKGNAWKLESVIYKNSKGHIVLPPRNPYLPISFECSSQLASSILRRKRTAIEALVDIYQKSPVKGSINLSPEVNDIRPFLWKKNSSQPRYTYFIDINTFDSNLDKRLRKQIRQARSMGYYLEKTNDLQAVLECLSEPEKRKSFDHSVDLQGLNLLNNLLGEDGVSFFIVKNKNDEVVASRILLHTSQGKVLAWSAGVITNVLNDGVNNFMIHEILNYLRDQGYKTFDFVGANIPNVATMKETWGGELITYYSIRSNSLRNLLIKNYQYAKQLLKSRDL